MNALSTILLLATSTSLSKALVDITITVRRRSLPGGTPRNSWWGCSVLPGSSNPDPISDQKTEIMLCRILRLDKQKKSFKSTSNSHTSISFLLIWNWNDKHVHTLRNSLENHTRLQTKMGKAYTRFQTKTAQKTYLEGQHIPIRLIPQGLAYRGVLTVRLWTSFQMRKQEKTEGPKPWCHLRIRQTKIDTLLKGIKSKNSMREVIILRILRHTSVLTDNLFLV